jgi:5-hydroxyisourate hydrolase
MSTTTNTLSTHVLDTATGKPAAGMAISLEVRGADGAFRRIGGGTTNDDGRVKDFLAAGESLPAGVYRVRFETAAYHAAQGVQGFYPYCEIVFEMGEGGQHYHVPLLISPFGFSTYRGS